MPLRVRCCSSSANICAMASSFSVDCGLDGKSRLLAATGEDGVRAPARTMAAPVRTVPRLAGRAEMPWLAERGVALAALLPDCGVPAD